MASLPKTMGNVISYTNLHKILIQIAKRFETSRDDSLYTKNNGKCGPPRNQTNYISFERY